MAWVCACQGTASDSGLAVDSGLGAADAGTLAAPDAATDAATDAPTDAATDGGLTDAGVADASVGGGDGGSRDAGALVDAGTDLVALFVASGHQGRTTISCDDGLTWVANQSDDDAFRCFAAMGNPDGGSSDCDHTATSGHGVVYADGWFIAAYGHGEPGSVRRSRDGVTWVRTLEGANFEGLVVGNGTVLAAARSPKWSTNAGLTWVAGAEADLHAGTQPIWNARTSAFGAGVFAIFGQDGTNSDIEVSSDNGQSWSQATVPSECGGAEYSVGFGEGGGKLLYVDQSTACVSTDGKTFTASALPFPAQAGPVWSGTQFLVWGQRLGPTYEHHLMTSPDGVTWSSQNTVTRRGSSMGDGPNLGAVGRSPQGTLVATNGGWLVWYEKQEFYRSTDNGVTWVALPTGAYVGSHPLSRIAWGLGAKSTACPGP